MATAASPVKKTRGWDANAHEALLLCLLDQFKPNKAALTLVAARMQEQGWSYSFDAINQHVQKLRKNRDTSGIAAATATPGGVPGTPKKTPSSAGRKRAKKGIEDDGVDDDEETFIKGEPAAEDDAVPVTPKRSRKKARATPAQSQEELKNEDGEY